MKRWRRVPLIIVGIFVIAFAYRVLTVYKFHSAECHAPPQARQIVPSYSPHLLVMTYNIEGHAAFIKPRHIDEIAKTINQIKPDIVGLNEIHRRTWQARFHDHIDLLRRLTRMNAVYGESYQQLGGQFGNAILTRGDIIRSEVFKLPGIGEPRSVLQALIRLDGRELYVYVTHLSAWGKINRGNRTDQLECLSHYLHASDHPYVLTGDLNAPPEAPEMESFRRDTALQICGEVIEPTQKLMNERIDYIFADRGWQVRSARTLDIGPSDHRPVIAELVHETH